MYTQANTHGEVAKIQPPDFTPFFLFQRLFSSFIRSYLVDSARNIFQSTLTVSMSTTSQL